MKRNQGSITIAVLVAALAGLFGVSVHTFLTSRRPIEIPADFQQKIEEQLAEIRLLQKRVEENFTPQMEERLGADAVLLIAGTFYTLHAGGPGSTDTSITLSSLTIPQTGQKLVDSDFSSTFYATLEPGSRTRQEIVSCTTVTQNSDGTATLSGCTRGLSPIAPYTASTTLRFSHAGGTRLIFSDPPQIFNQAVFKDNDETITGIHTFDVPPILNDANATSSSQAASRAYTQSQANQGASDISTTVKGIGKLAIASEAASSTSSSSTASALIDVSIAAGLPTGLSTSTIPVGISTGSVPYIDSSWLPTFQSITWRGPQTYNASTSIIAASTTTYPLYLNGIRYAFPNYNGASGTVLTIDGGGGLSWSGVSSLLGSQTAREDFSISPAASANAFRSTSVALPRNSLLPGGIVVINLSATSSIRNATGGNEPSSYGVEVSLGVAATSTCGYNFPAGVATDNASATTTMRFVIRRLTQSKQSLTCSIVGSGSPLASFISTSTTAMASTTDLTNPQTIVIMASSSMGALGAGTASMSISGIIVELLNPR